MNMQPPKSWTCEKRFKSFVFWFMYTRSSLKVLKLNFKKYRNSGHGVLTRDINNIMIWLLYWTAYNVVNWSNGYLVECLCNRSAYQIPVTGVSQIHLILNFNLTIPNIKIYGNGLPSFFFQRWTIIKYRHIGIFYNHLGKKKTYGVDSHKLCPIFLHKKHITIYCNPIPLPPKESETFDVRR